MDKSVSIPFLLFLVIVFMISPASADIISPGAKYVSSCVEIENTNDYHGYFFIVYPLYMTGGYEVIGPGDCVSFYKLASPEFYAVKESTFNSTAASTDGPVSAAYFSSDPGVIPSGLSIDSISAVPITSPVTEIRTFYSIVSVNPTHLEIEPVKVRYTYSDGKTEEKPLHPGEKVMIPSGLETIILVLALIAGLIIVVIVLRRRSRKP
jgi:hypothetical protein